VTKTVRLETFVHDEVLFLSAKQAVKTTVCTSLIIQGINKQFFYSDRQMVLGR
jgi:hypothetical protein